MTIAIDFDGVIHTYDQGWADGTIYGDFKPDAMPALETLMERDSVFIHTTRNARQVARWIERASQYHIDCTTHLPRTWYGRRKPFWNTRGLLLVTSLKLPATVYIDDRAHRFDDWPTTMVELGEPKEHWPSTGRGQPNAEQRIADAIAVIREWQRDGESNDYLTRVHKALNPPVSGTSTGEAS